MPPAAFAIGVRALCMPAKQVFVWTAAGEELAALTFRDVTTVKKLEQQLHRLCGQSRLRQRLVHNGIVLEDHLSLKRLPPPIDFLLVILPVVVPSDADAATLLAACCYDGDLKEVETMLKLPLDPNIHHPDAFRPPPLMGASIAGHSGIVRLLLEAGADKNIVFTGRTPAEAA